MAAHIDAYGSKFWLHFAGLEGASCLHLHSGHGFIGQCSGLFGLIRLERSFDGLSLGFAGLILDPFCKYVELTCKLLQANLGPRGQNADFSNVCLKVLEVCAGPGQLHFATILEANLGPRCQNADFP